MGVKVTKDNLQDLLDNTKALLAKRVLIGIPDSTADRETEPGETDNPPSNAQIGYWMEFGIPSRNVPARPFLVPGVQKIEGKIAAQMKAAGQQALSGGLSKIDIALNKAGLLAVNSVKAGITEGIPPPLAPSTIANRQSRGRTGETPLIDTGALLASITYVVRDKGK